MFRRSKAGRAAGGIGLLAVWLACPAIAQTPSSRQQLLDQNNSTFYRNGQHQLSGAAANSLLANVIASAIVWLTDLGPGVLTALGKAVNTTGGIATYPAGGGGGGTPGGSTGDLQTNAGSGTFGGLTPGTGVATAIGQAIGGTGGLTTQFGSIATNDCLLWGPGIKDAGIPCGGGFPPGGAVGDIQTKAGTTTFSGFTPGMTVVTTLGHAVNGASGLAAVNGAIATNDCLKWGPGITDAGGACGGGGGTVTAFATHALLVAGTTVHGTQTITQAGYAGAGDGGQAAYQWNATSVCPAGIATSGDGIVCILPSTQPSGTSGRYLLQIGNPIDVRTFGFAANGQDNSPFVAGLMLAMGGANTFSGGYDVVFPPVPGATWTSYYFSQSLILSRGAKYYCGGGTTNLNSISLVFAAGVHGVVQEDGAYTADGGAGNGMVEGCGIYSQGRAQGSPTPNSNSITGANLISGDLSGLAPASSWHNGDGLIVMPLQAAASPPNISPIVSPGAFVGSVGGGNNLTLGGSFVANPQTFAAQASFAQTSNSTNNFIVGDAITVGNSTYTFVTPIGSTPGNVLIGSSFLASASNLAGCINGNTTNALCVAQSSPPNVTMDPPFNSILKFWAAAGGTGGNSLTSTYTPAGTSAGTFGGATFSAGAASRPAFIVQLPVSQAFTVNTTSGSSSVLVTAGPRNLTPGEKIWNKDFPFGTTVLTVRGTALFTESGSNNFNVGDVITNVGNSNTINYHFVNSLVNPGDVLVGADWAASAANLSAAIGYIPTLTRPGTAWSGTGTISGNTLTLSGLTGTPWYGQTIAGAGVTGATILSGSGSTWTIDGAPQTVGPVSMTGTLNWIIATGNQNAAASVSGGVITEVGWVGPFNGSTITSVYTPSGTAAGSFNATTFGAMQTLTMDKPFLTGSGQNATGTTTGGTLWALPDGLKRDVTAQSRRLSFGNWFVGLDMSCEGNFLGNLNCTFSSDEDNLYEQNMVGLWHSGNNYSGSQSIGESAAKNYLADAVEVGALGMSYFNFNSHSGESGTSVYNILANCININNSFFQGGYFGGSSYPQCAATVGLLPATAGGPMVITPANTVPTGAASIGNGTLSGLWKVFGGQNGLNCVELGGPNASNPAGSGYLFAWATGGCQTSGNIWNLYPNASLGGNTFDIGIGVGNPTPVLRFLSGASAVNGGASAIGFPTGLAVLGTIAIASLPASCTPGTLAAISNGEASPTYNAAVSTTGTTVNLVFCTTGSVWTYH